MEIKDTILLPKTEFSMKADLPNKEPSILEKWQTEGIYKKLREASTNKEKFILHDGPPYANGHLHMGHALNKVLKDIIVKYQQLLNKNSIYVPGWDCHGLPIEWKIEEEYRAKKKIKMMYLFQNLENNVEILPIIGLISKKKNFRDWE